MDRSKLSILVPRMLERFPLMVPNRQFNQYRGFFSAGEIELYLHAYVPNLPTVKDMSIKEMSKELTELTENCKIEMHQWLSSKSRTFFDFLVWLQNLAIAKSTELTSLVVKPVEVPLEFWRNVVSILSSIGFNNVKCVDQTDLGHFELKVSSETDTHYMEVEANPDGSFQCKCPNLPERATQIIMQSLSIPAAFKSFEEQIMKLQLFWKVIQELDDMTWILDPIEPSLGHTRRQISIESGLSVTITVDPYSPLSLPDISFLGPDSKVSQLENKIQNKEWRTIEDSLFTTLQDFLEIEFPKRPDLNSSQMSQDQMCSICFAPEGLNRTCGMCDGQFHEECLLGWLQTVPSNRTAFNRILGKCPLCKQDISCVIPGK